MALVRTTNSVAIGAGDTAITVASATGMAAGMIIRCGDEQMRVAGGYTSGTSVSVLRGQEGTRAVAHAVTSGVIYGTGADWAQEAAPQTAIQFPLAGRARRVSTYGASGAISLPLAGTDEVAILNGTAAFAMTVAVPGKDLDGTILYIASDGAAAHTILFTGGLSGASTSYDVLTINATAPVLIGPIMAVNSLWQCSVAVAMAGNAATITATLG